MKMLQALPYDFVIQPGLNTTNNTTALKASTSKSEGAVSLCLSACVNISCSSRTILTDELSTHECMVFMTLCLTRFVGCVCLYECTYFVYACMYTLHV